MYAFKRVSPWGVLGSWWIKRFSVGLCAATYDNEKKISQTRTLASLISFYAVEVDISSKGGLKVKGVVVYDTSFGNTEKVAETIAGTLKESGIEVDLFDVKDVKGLSGKDYDFLVLGSPTKLGTMSFAIRFFFGKVNGEEWINKPFSAFDTELPDNLVNKEWSAAEKISEKLRDKGMKQLLPVLKAVVLGQKGPLKEGEVERTGDYARELAIKLREAKV